MSFIINLSFNYHSMTKKQTANTSRISFCAKLRNGNVVTGEGNIEVVKLKTQYGELAIPAKDLIQIDFGIIATEKTRQKVDALVDLLKSGTEAECKRTFKALAEAEVGAIAVLSQYLDMEDFECAYAEYDVESAIAALKAKYEIDDFITEDIISLNGDYRFPGVTDIETVALKTEFGDLTIPRDKIILLEIIAPQGDASGLRKFKLEANMHISANVSGGWLKTNIRIKKGQRFTIESKGEIIMASLSNQAHKPSGSYMPPGSTWTAGNDHDANAAPIFGNVVYKIGDNGPMLKAGTKVSTTAQTSGVLYLSIYETVFNAGNSGSYTVSVKL